MVIPLPSHYRIGIIMSIVNFTPIRKELIRPDNLVQHQPKPIVIEDPAKEKQKPIFQDVG